VHRSLATLVLAWIVVVLWSAAAADSASQTGSAVCRLSPLSARPPNAYMGGLSTHWLRQGKLWMGYTRADQSFTADPQGQKVAWYREAPGRLRISGTRLDGEAQPLRAHVPLGYGMTGFQSSKLTFSRPGCWQVVARLGAQRTYTFYLEVS
jgi:hypothetical protein